MADALEPAALLADRLADRLPPLVDGGLEIVLPAGEPALDDRRLRATRLELRQVAGLGAGGRLELSPGSWEIGQARAAAHLDEGDPDAVGFTLEVDDEYGVTVVPGGHPVRLGDEPLLEPTPLGDRIIDAGTARFVVGRPRPTRRRCGGDVPAGQVDPWVLDPLPRSGAIGSGLASLVAQRRRVHLAPDDLRHRIEAGRSHLWGRGPEHPLFGTAAVGVVDVDLAVTADGLGRPGGSMALPVAVDLLRTATVLAGSRHQQLAVARHLLLSLAATINPRDLRIGLRSERADLAFVRTLPHAAERAGAAGVRRRHHRQRTLLVVDRNGDNGCVRPGDLEPGPDMAVLALGVERGPIPDGAGAIGVTGDASLSVRCCRSGEIVRGATPIGLGPELAADLADRLAAMDADR